MFFQDALDSKYWNYKHHKVFYKVTQKHEGSDETEKETEEER